MKALAFASLSDAPIVGLPELRYRTCEPSKRDAARAVKVASPHAWWERIGAGILATSQNVCSEDLYPHRYTTSKDGQAARWEATLAQECRAFTIAGKTECPVCRGATRQLGEKR